jgi:pre-rRNA-processing protein IPI1
MGGQRGNSKKRKASNPGVGIDFKRVKHKVGKKLPKAQNETDTSFKARSINLPSQGLAEDKEGVATNSQNLTLKVCADWWWRTTAWGVPAAG